MQQWEYKVLPTGSWQWDDVTLKDLQIMNELGAQGWEAFAADNEQIFYKRPWSPPPIPAPGPDDQWAKMPPPPPPPG